MAHHVVHTRRERVDEQLVQPLGRPIFAASESVGLTVGDPLTHEHEHEA